MASAAAPTWEIHVPVDVYYVVKTTAELAHEPQHRVASRLYEIKAQAEIELERLRAADAAGEYSIWKASTYIEPARWAYDVVLADSTVLRHGDHSGEEPPD